MKYSEIEGDLISLAKEGKFDVVGHGCNCFCTMKRGLAPLMAEAFHCNEFSLEDQEFRGSIDKLGRIDYRKYWMLEEKKFDPPLYVVNLYTQYMWATPENPAPLDYEALRLCLRKMNHVFKGKHIGLPRIGCGLAGGNWAQVKLMIQRELKDCDVTIVIDAKQTK